MSDLFLGWNEYGTPIELPTEVRVRHSLILGQTGSGKSNLMVSMMKQDMEAGHGFMLIDPFGGLTDQVLSHVPVGWEEDVILIDLSDVEYPFGLNIFQDALPSEVTSLFRKVWGNSWGTLIQKWLQTITHTFNDAGEGTLVDIPRLDSDPDYRNRLVKRLKNAYARETWERHITKDGKIDKYEIGSTINRIGLFLLDDVLVNIVGQQKSTIDFRRCIAENKIVLWKLPEEGGSKSETVSLLGTLIFQLFRRAAMSQYWKNPYYFYADEFQKFATPDIKDLIGGMRQFGSGLILATQDLGQVPEEVRNGVMGTGTKIVFQPSIDDARLFRQTFADLKKESEEYNGRRPEKPKPPPPPDAEPIDDLVETIFHHRLKGKHRSLYEAADVFLPALMHQRSKTRLALEILEEYWTNRMTGEIEHKSDEEGDTIERLFVQLYDFFGGFPYYDEETGKERSFPANPERLSTFGEMVRSIWELRNEGNSHTEIRELVGSGQPAASYNFFMTLEGDPHGTACRPETYEVLNQIVLWEYLIRFVADRLAKNPHYQDVGPVPEEPEEPWEEYTYTEEQVNLLELESVHGKGSAAVRTPDGVYLISTPLMERGENRDAAALIRLWSREDYCRPRAEVEAEIRSRRAGSDPAEHEEAADFPEPPPQPSDEPRPPRSTDRERWLPPEPDTP